jgi:hypothetical protein
MVLVLVTFWAWDAAFDLAHHCFDFFCMAAFTTLHSGNVDLGSAALVVTAFTADINKVHQHPSRLAWLLKLGGVE